MIVVDRDEREVPLELGVGRLHGLDEIPFVFLLDQVSDDLGVRLRAERVSSACSVSLSSR